MMSRKPAIPWVLIALDAFGTILVVLGVLGLTGVNFSQQVLTTVAPGFIAIGILLMVPLIVWIVLQVRNR
jgi:hypothetical protein